jgi:hypothetical protein
MDPLVGLATARYKVSILLSDYLSTYSKVEAVWRELVDLIHVMLLVLLRARRVDERGDIVLDDRAHMVTDVAARCCAPVCNL